MSRRSALGWAAAGVALLAAVPGANAAAAKKAPTLSPVTATFLGTEVKATQYSVTLTLAPGDLSPTFSWKLKPPADDPTCNNFRSQSSNHDPTNNTAIWHHADVSESPADGCHHKDPQHLGTVSVDVTVPFQGDQGRPWICHASYFGSLTGVGDDPGPGGCTIEAPAKHAVVSLGITVKEQADIDIAYYQDCVDTYTKEAVAFGLLTAVPGPQQPLFGAGGAVATATAWQCDQWKKQAEKRKKDPADPHFLVVARPVAVKELVLQSIAPALTKALSALEQNAARSNAANNALLTAINRAQGAHNAHNLGAQATQLKAAGKDALLLAQLDLARAGLRKAVIKAARDAKLNTLVLTPAQVQSAVNSGSLPKSVLAQLAKLHAGSVGIADLTAALKSGASPTAPVSLLAGLADGRVTAAEKKEAAALRAYAASVGVR